MHMLKPTYNNGTMPTGQPPSNMKTANDEKRKKALLVVGTTGIIDSPLANTNFHEIDSL